jgi:hypothetical protein
LNADNSFLEMHIGLEGSIFCNFVTVHDPVMCKIAQLETRQVATDML